MKKLTKKQKIAAYKFALKEVKADVEICVCPSLLIWSNTCNEVAGCFPHQLKKIFPEFNKFKPKKILFGGLWWPCDIEGQKTRISVLKSIIKELEG